MQRIDITDAKKDYIRFLLECKPFIKLNYFCNLVNINQATLSKMLSNELYYNMISENKLSELCSVIVEKCDSVMWL